MIKIMLGVIGNGRGELLSQTLASLTEMVEYPFDYKVLIDDTGNAEYQKGLMASYGEYFDEMVLHNENRGLSGSIRSLWAVALEQEVDYLWHIEEDFLFNEKIDIRGLWKFLAFNTKHVPPIAQIALKRQPCNPEEAAAGGFMEMKPDSYEEQYWWATHCPDFPWTKHRNFFTLNPSLYPRWVMELGWEEGWGEKEFGERLFADPDVYCGYLGRITDPPKVNHIGGYRAEGWKV